MTSFDTFLRSYKILQFNRKLYKWKNSFKLSYLVTDHARNVKWDQHLIFCLRIVAFAKCSMQKPIAKSVIYVLSQRYGYKVSAQLQSGFKQVPHFFKEKKTIF